MSAKYYLSRGPSSEGPFEEAHLVRLIQSGELTQGGVCLIGQEQWCALDAIPAFAQALATRSAPVAPRVAATIPEHLPAQGEGAQPPPGAPAAPAVRMKPGGTVPDHDPAAEPSATRSPAPAAGSAVTPARRSDAGMIIGVIAGGALIVLGGIALALYFFVFSSGGAPSIASVVPRDCELLVELSSARKAVLALRDVRFLDTSLSSDRRVLDAANDTLVKAFDLSPSAASALLAATETVGFAARKLESKPEVVLALGVRSTGPVEALLKSPRFATAGAVGRGGQRYTLTRRQPIPGQDLVSKELFQAEVGATDSKQLVWFPKQQLLALGDAALMSDVAQVVEAGAATIEQNPAYQAARKDFDPDAQLTAFVDPGALSNVTNLKVKQLASAYFTPTGPLTGSMHIDPAGFIASITGHISGSKLPPDGTYGAPQALTLSNRLPAETLTYVAFSSQTKLSGAEIEKLLLNQLDSVDARTHNEAEQSLRQFEQLLGVSTAKLIDSLAGQGVIGLAAPPDSAPGELSGIAGALTFLNVTYVQELKDDTEFKKLAAQLQARVLPSARELKVTPDGAGFTLTDSTGELAASLHLKFLDKYLFITVGSNSLCERAELAFTKGTKSLNDDAAHRAALSALPATSQLQLWLDTGRLLDTFNKNPLLRPSMIASGLPLDKLTLTGPNRMVTALSLRSEAKLEVWTVRMDVLNPQALAPLGAGASLLLGGLPTLPGL